MTRMGEPETYEDLAVFRSRNGLLQSLVTEMVAEGAISAVQLLQMGVEWGVEGVFQYDLQVASLAEFVDIPGKYQQFPESAITLKACRELLTDNLDDLRWEITDMRTGKDISPYWHLTSIREIFPAEHLRFVRIK